MKNKSNKTNKTNKQKTTVKCDLTSSDIIQAAQPHKYLDALNIRFRTKEAQLICPFCFAYADCWLSDALAYIVNTEG